MEDRIKELESTLEEDIAKGTKLKKKLFIIFILVETLWILLLVIYHFIINNKTDSFNSFVHMTLPILISLLIFPLLLDFLVDYQCYKTSKKISR